MTGFLVRRAIQAVAIVFAVVTVTFFMVRFAPGDPLTDTSGRALPPSFLEEHARRLGLEQPKWQQYVTFLGNVARGDLGRSFRSRRPVSEQLAPAFVNTVILGVAAILVTFGIGIVLGTIQALRQGSRFDHASSIASLVLLSIPMFWLGLLAVHVLGTKLGLVPAFGTLDPLIYDQLGLFGKLLHRLHHLALPATVLGLSGAAWTARYMRAQTIEVSHQPHVRTARAKGLTENVVVIRHIARNALIPIATLFGLYLPGLLSGAVFVEYVFVWHGLGWEAASAMTNNDYPVIVGVAMLTATLVVIGSVVADVLYRVVDPRVAIR